jgi:hypothetical protein
MGCGLSCRLFGSKPLVCWFSCMGMLGSACVSVCRLSWVRRWGNVVSVVGCGKLYFCVVVIVCC